MRDQRAAETRARIVGAGADILRDHPIWDWGALTVRAVAERVAVNERTVYRYFATERALRDAVMDRFEADAGVDLEGLTLDGLQAFTTQILQFVSSFPVESRTPRDPTLTRAGQRQHSALLAAVGPATESWPEADRAVVAAIFDVLWSMGTYERLVADWGLDPAQAVRAVTWAISLVQDAITSDRRPGT